MMAALEGIHVFMLGDDTEVQDKQNGSEGGRTDERLKDGESCGGVSEDEDRANNTVQDDRNTSAGWAEAMAKILEKKTAECKSSILGKNKELDKKKETEQQQQLERKKKVDKRRALEMMCRMKPDIVKDRETERALQRIATRGVVQLFNAVKKHQKNVDDKVKEVDGSERKKAKILSSVSKKDFITVLRRTEGGSRTAEKKMVHAVATEEKPAWSILRDDFMMAATMKDWDKDSERESDSQTVCGEVESDSN